MPTVVCVDGPAASGKSTVSKAAAAQLGYLYVDSGALYRIATLLALEADVDTNSPDALVAFAGKQLPLEFIVRDGRVACEVNGEEPGDRIRTPEINRHVSPVSAVPEIRKRVTGWLHGMLEVGNLIVEGRDIGSVVFPESPYRFYLDADPDERTRRRFREDMEKGFADKNARESVKASLLSRDRIDSSRKTAPLVVPEGATRIDTTKMSVDEVVAAIVNAVRRTCAT